MITRSERSRACNFTYACTFTFTIGGMYSTLALLYYTLELVFMEAKLFIQLGVRPYCTVYTDNTDTPTFPID